MKRTFILIVLILGCRLAVAQKINAEFNIGYGFYNLHDIKLYQNDMAESKYYIYDRKVTTFPSYYNYNASLEYLIKNNIYTGIDFGFYSTGGRNHIADYSGEYKLDMMLNSYKEAVHFKYLISTFPSSSEKFRFYGEVKTGIMHTKMSVSEYFIIYGIDSTYTSDHYISNVFFIEPSAMLSYKVMKNIYINIGLGYEMDLKNKLHNEKDKSHILTDTKDDKISASWSGLRFNSGISIGF